MATTSSSFRSSNKANSEWLHDDDLFEQFIATGSLNLCDSNTADAEALDNTLVDLGNSNSEDSRVPPGEKDEEEEEEEDDTGGVDISGSHQHHFGGDESCESAPQETNNAVTRELEDIINLFKCDTKTSNLVVPEASSSGQIPPTPYPYMPPTPPPTDVISSSESAKSERMSAGTVRRFHRKSNSSPAMAQPMSAHHGRNPWAHRLEASAELFDKHYQRGPVSPPPSASLGEWEDSMAFNSQAMNANTSLQQSNFQPASTGGYATLPTSSGQQFGHTPPDSFYNPCSNPDTIITSPQVDRTLSWDGTSASPYQFSLDSTSMHQSFDDTEVQQWWPPNSMPYVGTDMQHYPPQRRPARHNSMAPGQSYNSPTSPSSMAGLMISDSGLGSPFSPIPSIPYQQQTQQNQIVYPSDPVEHPYQTSDNYCRRRMSSYNSVSHSQSSRSSSPSRRARTPSVPYSGSGSGSGSSHRRAASRSRSTHRNSAAVDTHAHHNHAQSHHRRSKSQGAASVRSPTKSGYGSVSSGPSNAGFVNFTPQDSRRILTGVAPSGSSKTKARREKEAAEKRKKLNLAARRAVIQAGGDIGALEREGLYAVA